MRVHWSEFRVGNKSNVLLQTKPCGYWKYNLLSWCRVSGGYNSTIIYSVSFYFYLQSWWNIGKADSTQSIEYGLNSWSPHPIACFFLPEYALSHFNFPNTAISNNILAVLWIICVLKLLWAGGGKRWEFKLWYFMPFYVVQYLALIIKYVFSLFYFILYWIFAILAARSLFLNHCLGSDTLYLTRKIYIRGSGVPLVARTAISRVPPSYVLRQ